jgi:hypothetical protein
VICHGKAIYVLNWCHLELKFLKLIHWKVALGEMAELEDGKLKGQQGPAHLPQRRQAGAVVTRFARFNAKRSEACGGGGGKREIADRMRGMERRWTTSQYVMSEKENMWWCDEKKLSSDVINHVMMWWIMWWVGWMWKCDGSMWWRDRERDVTFLSDSREDLCVGW